MGTLLRRVRQFFWMSTIMGILAIFTNFKPSGLKEKASDFLVHGPSGKGSAVEEIKEKPMVPENVMPAPSEPGGSNSDQPLLSSSGKAMIWKAKRYVLIHNKWVVERPDHVYIIDGMRTYFRDSGHYEIKGANGEKKQAPQANVNPEDSAVLAARKRGGRAQQLLQRISANPLSAYSPETIKELGEALSDAKASITERDKVLEELSK